MPRISLSKPGLAWKVALRLFLASVLLWLAGSLCSHGRKNVLILIADDLNRMISPLGDPNAITPNLDRLAARSVCFDNATCQFPFCAPSRTSVFMGLYPWIHGIQNASPQFPSPHLVFPDRVGLPEYFRQNGYWTASYGKTEHVFQPRNWNIQTTDFRTSPWRPDYDPGKRVHADVFNYAGVTGKANLEVYDLHPNEFIDGVSTTAALNDLAAHRADPDHDPFFVVVGWDEPHSRWEVPQQIYDQYDSSSIVLSGSSTAGWPVWALRFDDRPVIPDQRRRELFHAYLSGVTLMDYQLGRLLDYLDAEQLWEDTVVIFFSDNGFSLCEHQRLYAKRNISRENVSVPLMIHDPALQRDGQVCSRQVELQDLFPTLVDLCGLPPYPRYLDGRSIKPLLLDPTAPWPHVAKAVLGNPGSTAATAKIVQLGSLKIADGGGENDLFIDHATDLSEVNVELGTTESPPPDARWAPLLDCINNEFGFTRGRGLVFYSMGSFAAPDRDYDGVSDSEDMALATLGFAPWRNNRNDWELLMRGPSLSRSPDSDSLRVELPGFSITPLRGFENVQYLLPLEESEDLENWVPSTAGNGLESGREGALRWIVPARPPHTRKFYRFAIPRL